MSLLKQRIVGEGTYGKVYYATKSNDSSAVAVKRNLADSTTTGIGSLKEIDILCRLKGHPFIVNVESICFGEPFEEPMSPIKSDNKYIKDDKVHFVLEFVPITLNMLLSSPEMGYRMMHAKILMCQLLLGVEWMHAQGIIHRDFKPANLLISSDKNGPRLRICDFGMSKNLSYDGISSPGVTTSWYRAPEICCSAPYGLSADIWSIGCIFFEMINKYPLLYNIADSNEAAFNAILSKLPQHPNQNVIQKLFEEGKFLKIRMEASPIRRKSFREQLNLNTEIINDFNTRPGTLDEYIDLLEKLLVLDPTKRLTASQALEHPFFNWLKGYISNVRKIYPPIYPTLPVIKITKCIERSWMINLAFSIYNYRSKIYWYTHRILFHAIDLFDRYIEWAFSDSNVPIQEESVSQGKLHDKVNTEIRFYVCLYFWYKYFLTMHMPISWNDFTAPEYTVPQVLDIAQDFEVLLMRDICKYNLYRDTLLEIPFQYKHTLNEELIYKLLVNYGNIESYDSGSVRALYRYICGIN